MEIPFPQRVQAMRKIADMARNDADPAVRQRCQEVVAMMKADERGTLFDSALAIASNTLALAPARLRALDVLTSMLQK